MEVNNIPVVFATDQNYLWPTSVAIISLLKNAEPNTFYEIFILTSSSLSANNMLMIDMIENKYCSGKIKVIVVGDIFKDSYIGDHHITTPSYYRLIISEVLKHYSKCIYLDGDIIVQKDLSDFFNLDINNYYVAGVKALGYHILATKHADRLGLNNIDNYINAGVLLMNLDKLREDKIDTVFKELSSRIYDSHDQDIINIACASKIKILPLKYNWMTRYFIKGYPNRIKIGCVSSTDGKILTEIQEEPYIIHYADKIKPWNSKNCYLGIKWWEYAKDSPFTNIQVDNIKEDNLDDGVMELDDLLELIKEDKYDGYYIYSAGSMGEFVYKVWSEYASTEKLLGFIDNRDEFHGKVFCNYVVIPYSKCIDKSNILFILSPSATNAKNLLDKDNRKYQIVRI